MITVILRLVVKVPYENSDAAAKTMRLLGNADVIGELHDSSDRKERSKEEAFCEQEA